MRLEAISRTLSEAFLRASDAQKAGAVILACEFAVLQTGLRGRAVDAALEIIREGRSDAAVQLEIEALSESFDDEYFRMRDEGQPAPIDADALLHFRRARAAAALAFAVSLDCDLRHEALYEAAFASHDRAGVVRSVEAALCKAQSTTG